MTEKKQKTPAWKSLFLSYVKKDQTTGRTTYNVNNVTVNYLLSPIYFLVLTLVLWKGEGVPLIGRPDFYDGSLFLALMSTLIYCYSSTFFQPDLDHSMNRPGKHAFPFGSTISNWEWGFILRKAFRPVTIFWNIMWHPFAYLFTHRGAVHWPVIGVWLRIGWLWFWWGFFFPLSLWMGHFFSYVKGTWIVRVDLKFIPVVGVLFTDLNSGFWNFTLSALEKLVFLWQYALAYMEVWMRAFFPWNPEFGTLGFFLFCFPIFMSDLFHAGVDMMESNKKGTAFVSPMARRGLLIKIYRWVSSKPKEILDHIKKFQ